MPLTNLIPTDFQSHAKAIAAALETVNNVVVSAHVNPDGDAVGSIVSAACLLQARGKNVVLYSSTGIPDFLSWFPLPAPLVVGQNAFPFSPEAAFLVDLGEFHRIGGSFEELAKTLPRINVDHHEGDGIGTLARWVEPGAASTTELLAYTALQMGVPLSGMLADAIAMGLVTDTGGFSHANTSARVFQLCAHLVQNGCNIAALRESIDGNMRFERMALWARLVPKVQILADGAVAFCAILLEDFAACNAKREDIEGFVEYLRRLKGVKISIVLREDGESLCKFSMRSVPSVDVWRIAQKFQGGGHKNAAGGTLRLPQERAAAALQEAVCAELAHEA